MVAIPWNPLGLPLIVALPKGRTFNAEYYRDNILAALTRLQREEDGRKLIDLEIHLILLEYHSGILRPQDLDKVLY
jgi:hypothetical protein